MKLENILLGVLLQQASTGYDLKKYLDTSGRSLRSNTQMYLPGSAEGHLPPADPLPGPRVLGAAELRGIHERRRADPLLETEINTRQDEIAPDSRGRI
jgi:hypothetical protein